MGAARGIGIVVGAALATAILLYLAFFYGGTLPFPLGTLLQIVGVGVPAYFSAALAGRWRLSQPAVLAAAGYCLGSGINTAVMMGGGETPVRYMMVALIHAVSLTILAPTTTGGFMPFLMNPLWVVAAYLIAREGQSTARRSSRDPAPPTTQEPR